MAFEREVRGFSGWGFLILLFAVLFGGSYALVQAARDAALWSVLLWSFVLVLDIGGFGGFSVVNPNEARVLILFGVYKGTIKTPGFWWVNPLTIRRRMSLRIRKDRKSVV